MLKSILNPSGYQACFFFVFFFLICFGLGYPTLNRYDPRTVIGVSDSIHYFNLVQSGPQQATGHFRYRVLVPYLARPIARLAQGRIGTWNATAFGLLVVNSALVAISAFLVLLLGLKLLGDYAVALTGSLLFLLNFTVANYQLSSLVDSGEGCFLLLVILALVTNRWKFLPVLGIVGALAKETFVPLSFTLAAVYGLLQPAGRTERLSRLMWVVSLGVTGLGTVLALQSFISGKLVLPLTIVAAEKHTDNLLLSIGHALTGREFWYVFIWLLPLGAIRLKYFPQPLVYGSLAGAVVALVLGAWNESGGNLGRPIFNVAGPLLTLSLADLVVSLGKSWRLLQIQRK
jgi:hypothetical protein